MVMASVCRLTTQTWDASLVKSKQRQGALVCYVATESSRRMHNSHAMTLTCRATLVQHGAVTFHKRMVEVTTRAAAQNFRTKLPMLRCEICTLSQVASVKALRHSERGELATRSAPLGFVIKLTLNQFSCESLHPTSYKDGHVLLQPSTTDHRHVTVPHHAKATTPPSART